MISTHCSTFPQMALSVMDRFSLDPNDLSKILRISPHLLSYYLNNNMPNISKDPSGKRLLSLYERSSELSHSISVPAEILSSLSSKDMTSALILLDSHISSLFSGS